MSDLISRGKLFNLLAPVQTLGEAYGIIQGMDTVDAVEVVHGHWIERGYMGNDNWDYMCSVCGAGEVHTKRVEVRYCWNCGARMDGKGNGNEID